MASSTTLGTSGSYSADPRSRRGQLLLRWRYLEQTRQSWLEYYRELSDYIFPRRNRYLFERAHSRGNSRHGKIIDNKAVLALRTFESGMQGTLTPPNLPWFRIRTKDRALMEDDEVRIWLHEATKVCQDMLDKSNFYAVILSIFGELGAFGTSAMWRERDYGAETLHFRDFTCGEFAIAQNSRDRVDTIGRCYAMTVSQIVEEFIKDPSDPDMFHWERCSSFVKSAWEEGRLDDELDVVHLVQPRRKREGVNTGSNLDMPFESVYFELGGDGDEDMLLRESGYEEFPAYVVRWRVHGRDIYGSSPAMDCLGDSKQLQSQQLQKSQAMAKAINPPLKADVELRNRATSSVAGGITYIQSRQGQDGISPIYQIQTPTRDLTEDIQDVRRRIADAMYEPLFAQFAFNNPEGDKMTATEVARRHAEQLNLLTPMNYSLNRNLFSPMVKELFAFAMELGKLPPMPQALMEAERPLDIEYTSLMAQAQEATTANGIERLLSFGGNLTGVAPEAMDNYDIDKAIRTYARIIGVEADVLRKEVDVDKLRKAREEREAMEQGLADAEQGAATAKLLSETDTAQNSALTAITGQNA